MGYKKDVILKFRDEKKQEELINRLTKKIERMTPEQRKAYCKTISQKLEILKAEIKDIDLEQMQLPNKVSREISSDAATGILLFSFILGTLITAGFTMPDLADTVDSEGFSRFMLGAAMGFVSLLGGIGGFLIGGAAGVAYEASPLTNLINKIRRQINNKKLANKNTNIDALNKESEILNKMIEQDDSYKTCGAESSL